MSKYVLYIKNVQDSDPGDWFVGPGWYFIDETQCLQWGGHCKGEAVARLKEYADNL